MQNQQTQQNPQNGAQPFFPMGQGPNNSDPHQIGTENNSNASDPNTATRQEGEISSQIGGVAIGGAAIGGAAINGAAIGGTAIGGAAIGGTAIGGAAIDGVATGASQAESSIQGVQEPLDAQTLPNTIDDAIDGGTQESTSNPEVGGVNTEATNIIPFPSRESQSPKDEQNADDQTQTDGLPHMALEDNRGDSLSKENQEFVKQLIKIAPEDPSKFYQKAAEARKEYLESIRGDAA